MPKMFMLWLIFNVFMTAAALTDFWIYTFRIQQFRSTLCCGISRAIDKGKSYTTE